VRLHNYPKFLQNLVQDNGELFDLGAVDILRDRERGVPRYNRFRQRFGRLSSSSSERSFRSSATPNVALTDATRSGPWLRSRLGRRPSEQARGKPPRHRTTPAGATCAGPAVWRFDGFL